MSNFLKTITNSIKYWYIPLIVGVLFILLGTYIFTVPLETYAALSIIFSISFVISGIFDTVFSIQNRQSLQGWGWYFVGGLLTLGVGVYMTINPITSMAVLPFFAGFTMLFRSFQLLGYSLDMKDLKILNWGNVAIASIIGILFSFLLIASPIFTGLSLVTLTALSFIFVGVATIMLSLNLKKIKDIPSSISNEFKDKINNIMKEVEDLYARK